MWGYDIEKRRVGKTTNLMCFWDVKGQTSEHAIWDAGRWIQRWVIEGLSCGGVVRDESGCGEWLQIGKVLNDRRSLNEVGPEDIVCGGV